MKKVTFDATPNKAGVAKAIHKIMESSGWGLYEAKVAMEKGVVEHLDQSTAEKLKVALEEVGADNIKISDE